MYVCREAGYATRDCSSVLRELANLVSRDPTPCNVAGTMVSEAFDVALEAYRMFMHVNFNDPESFRSVTEVKARLENLLSSLLSRRVTIVYTYGGSESTLTALYAIREAYKVRGVVASKAAHASVFKACRVLRLRCHRVNVDYDLVMDVESLERVLRNLPYPVAVVATLGLTDNGALDPINEIVEVALRYDAPVYVDAVFGGFYLIGMGRTDLLTLEGVKAFSLDPHKLFTPPGSGLLVLLDEKLADVLRFTAPYMPAGSQESLLWTRSAAGLAAAYAGLSLLGASGLRKLAETLIDLAQELKDKLVEQGIPVYSKPWTPLVPFNVGRTVERVRRRLTERGLILYPSRIPGTLRYIAKWCHTSSTVNLIAETVAEALR